MTAMQRITGADWRAWFYYLAFAVIRGTATSVRSAISVGTGAALSVEQWSPALVDLRLLLYTAAVGFVLAFTEFLASQPLPKGDEVADTMAAA